MPAKSPIEDGRTVVGPERRTCPDYDSDDADVELISSDNVLFKVHSFTLQHASLVFRSMISMASSTAQRDPITLTDDRLENSKVVKRVLDIVYNLDIGKQKTDQDMYLLRHVIDFAKKWEMEIVIKTIQREMWRRIDSKSGNPDLFRHFLIALALGDTKLAASCYKSSKIESSIPSPVRFVEPSTEDDSESDSELESDSDSDSDDSSEEENDSEEGSSSDSDEGSDSDGAPRLGQNSVTAGSSTNVPYPPLYVSDHISDSLLHRSFNTHEPGFNLNNMGYKQFLLLPPTVVWIILRAQRAQRRGGPYWNSRDQAEYVEALLNKAYPATVVSHTGKKRKAAD